MGIKNIQVLSTNPHFSALLLHSFLTGYGKECDLSIVMMVLPLLYNSEMRKKLLTANKQSSPKTLFLYPQQGNDLSGQSKLAGFWNKYDFLETMIKRAIIILNSQKKIIIQNNKVYFENELHYKDFSGCVCNWLRASYYLGVILRKATNEDLLFIVRS